MGACRDRIYGRGTHQGKIFKRRIPQGVSRKSTRDNGVYRVPYPLRSYVGSKQSISKKIAGAVALLSRALTWPIVIRASDYERKR